MSSYCTVAVVGHYDYFGEQGGTLIRWNFLPQYLV